MDRNYDVITFQNTFILRKPRVANFVDIIQTIFIKITFKVSKKLKEVEIMY